MSHLFTAIIDRALQRKRATNVTILDTKLEFIKWKFIWNSERKTTALVLVQPLTRYSSSPTEFVICSTEVKKHTHQWKTYRSTFHAGITHCPFWVSSSLSQIIPYQMSVLYLGHCGDAVRLNRVNNVDEASANYCTSWTHFFLPPLIPRPSL